MAVAFASANFFGMIGSAILRSNSGPFTPDTLNGPMIRQKMRELGMPPIAICQLGIEVGEVESTLRAASRKLGDFCVILDAMPLYTRKATIAQIEVAMQQVAKTAAQLEKVDLETDEGLKTMFDALGECERSFAQAASLADDRLKTMSGIHAQIVEVQTVMVIPLKGRLDGIKNSFLAGIQGNAQQYKNAKERSKTEQIALNNLQSSIGSLEEKIRDDQSTKEVTDTIFDIFTLGIYHAVEGHAPDPMGLQDAIDNKRRDLQNAMSSHQKTADIQMVLTYQMGQIRQQSMYMLAACGRVPRMLEQIESVIETSLHAQRQLAVLKDDASALVRQAQDLKNKARNTKDLGVDRQEFADGLTAICNAAKLDPKLNKVIGIALDTINPSKTIDTTKTLSIMAANQEKTDARRIIGQLGVPAISRLPIPASARHVASDLFIGVLGVPVAHRQAVAA